MGSEYGTAAAFGLRNLTGELLEGVLQRLGGKAKRQAELIDQGFAAIAHRGAWRHRHSLIIDYSDDSFNRKPSTANPIQGVLVGPFEIDPAHTTSAARFLRDRSAIHHVEFIIADCSPISDTMRTQGRAVLAALLASERVELRTLLLGTTAARLFDSTDELVALIGRNAATLQQAMLGLDEYKPESAVHAALHVCPSLHKLTAIQCGYKWRGTLRRLVGGLHLSALTLCGDYQCHVDLSTALPTAPTLQELHLNGAFIELAALADCTALQNARLLETEELPFDSIDFRRRPTPNLPLCDESKMKLILSYVLPNLETLLIRRYHPHGCWFWRNMRVLATAFFNRPGDHSLAVQLSSKYWFRWANEGWRQLGVWRAAFPDLLVERFDAVAAEQGDAARPSLPKEFDGATDSAVFVLRRHYESRWLLIAVWK